MERLSYSGPQNLNALHAWAAKQSKGKKYVMVSVVFSAVIARRTDKLPKEGMDPQVIQGITVWVNPAAPKKTVDRWGKEHIVKSSKHRVMARCPVCGEEMSAGRLHQHAKIHA